MMRTFEDGEERPLAWTAILENTPIESSSGQKVGTTAEVLGAEDIFHGIEMAPGPMGTNVLIPAEHVTSITNRRVSTDLDDEQIRQLPPYVPEESFHLGFVGVLRKHLGWTDEGSGPA